MIVYDENYKRRAVEYFYKTKNRKSVVEVFSISYSTLYRWIKQSSMETGLKPKTRLGRPKKFSCDKLLDYITENPDARLKDMRKFMECSEPTILKILKEIKVSNKKNAVLRRTQRRKKA